MDSHIIRRFNSSLDRWFICMAASGWIVTRTISHTITQEGQLDWIKQCLCILRDYVPANTVQCIGYMGDGFYRSKDPTNSIKVLKEHTCTTDPEIDRVDRLTVELS